MRHGFTTGSCSAAAAKAAAYMLLSGREKNQIEIQTPKEITYRPEIEEIVRAADWVSCGVRKDGGDDPDITTGNLICAKVAYNSSGKPGEIVIDGGVGVGRVTKPGLDQPVGNAAINHVPREMIEASVRDVCEMFDYAGSLAVEIFVPNGEALAQKTFNPRLGIEGGISILGTTGIVEPMSKQALLDTIRVELNMKRVRGDKVAYISPGNYGLEFMKNTYGYDLDQSVKCSNFIGETLDMAAELGFEKVLLTGHIGKLVKVAGGIMNTHSKEADCRMEILVAAALREGVDVVSLGQILDCVTTEEAVAILEALGKKEAVMKHILERILFYCNHRVQGKIQVACIVYANDFGELAKSADAVTLLQERKDADH